MKKLLFIILTIFVLTTTYGCGNKTETDKAKETVDNFFAALKDADFKKAADFVLSEEQEQMRNTQWEDDLE